MRACLSSRRESGSNPQRDLFGRHSISRLWHDYGIRAATPLLCGAGLIFAFAGSPLRAQSSSSAPSPNQAQTAPSKSDTQEKSQQKPDRVTTTVVVHGEVKDDYLADT